MAAEHPDAQVHRNRLIPTLAPAFVILAAGLGTRFGGDKPLARVTASGATLLDFAIFDAAGAGFDGPVIVVQPELEDAFRNHLDEQFGSSLRPTFVHQATPLGTGHALLCTTGYLDRPFAVANADDFYGRSSYELLFRELRRDGTDSYVTVYRLADTLSPFGGVSRAVCRADADGALTEITEVLDIRETDGRIQGRTPSGTPVALTGDESISMSLFGFRSSFVPALRAAYGRFRGTEGEFRLSDATDVLVRGGEVRVRMIRVPEAGFGVTFSGDVEPTRRRIEALIEQGDYPARFGAIAMRPVVSTVPAVPAEPEEA